MSHWLNIPLIPKPKDTTHALRKNGKILLTALPGISTCEKEFSGMMGGGNSLPKMLCTL